MSEEDIYIGETSIQIGQHGFINQPKEIIDYIICLQNQLQQKENIIKEVRELIKRDLSTDKVNNLIYSELLDIIGEENKDD